MQKIDSLGIVCVSTNGDTFTVFSVCHRENITPLIVITQICDARGRNKKGSPSLSSAGDEDVGEETEC